MKLIITMAGEYTRFIDFSSEIPKYLLPIKKGLVLDAVIAPYTKCDFFNEVVLVCNENDKKFYKIVKERLKYFPKTKNDLIYIKSSSSQVDTAIKALEFQNSYNSKIPVLITNIDTILLERNFKKILAELNNYDGILDSFRAFDKEYSYIIANDKKEVINIKEKIQISEMASSGLYGFNSVNEFFKVAKESIKSIKNFSELYQIMINRGKKIKVVHNELAKNTIVVGTPTQYLDFISSE